MVRDLAERHAALGALGDWTGGKLTSAQTASFHQTGFLSRIRILTEEQVEVLRGELARLMDPAHPGHDLFYEFHTNESGNSGPVLFHALGAWRIEPGFHDILWHPAFVGPAAQLLDGGVRFW